RDYALALAAYLRSRHDLNSGYRVYDINDDDNYVRTLRQAIENQFGERYLLTRRRIGFAGTKKPQKATPALFDRAIDNICSTQADVVFYAGRERDLPAFVTALTNRGQCGHDKPIAILTGATGLGRTQGDPTVLAQLTRSNISIIDASSTSALEWSAGHRAPPGYPAFHEYFTNTLRLPETELIDGYAIMHHDALATAIWSAR